jgi:hypothetical protein
MSWFWIILLCALCGGIGCAINKSKNRSGGEGFLLGALLGVIGIIIVLCLPKLPAPELPRAWPALPPPGWYQDPADPTQHRWWVKFPRFPGDFAIWDWRALVGG